MKSKVVYYAYVDHDHEIKLGKDSIEASFFSGPNELCKIDPLSELDRPILVINATTRKKAERILKENYHLLFKHSEVT